MTMQKLWDNIWKDKHGKVVLWQAPNVWLWMWIINTVLTHILPYGRLNFAAALVSFGSLFAWAFLEMTEGVDYFRRTIGLIVLVLSISSRI